MTFSRIALLAALAVAFAPAAASAQQVQLRMQNGRVSLDVRSVPIVQVLKEWARVGDVKIVNAEKVPGPPVTLQLSDVPEREALEILLRGAAGYMLGVRAPGATGASAYDRILILATSGTAPRNPPPPTAAQPMPRYVPTQSDNDGAPDPATAVGGVRRFPPPAIRPVVGMPPSDPPPDAGTPSAATPATPANPFGVPAGSGLPGAITPLPAPQPQQAPTRR